MYLLALNAVAANLIGYVIRLLLSLALNGSWTFAHKGAVGRSPRNRACRLGSEESTPILRDHSGSPRRRSRSSEDGTMFAIPVLARDRPN
jgi:hypothetical protein